MTALAAMAALWAVLQPRRTRDTSRPPARVLRVCADPDNLPFSNDRGEGLENRLAEMMAREQGAQLHYTWHAQRRGFVRETLGAGLCDVIAGVPASFDRLLVTRPYYRSTYVFVSRTDRALGLRSLDDPRLHRMRVGVQLVGDDFSDAPLAQALESRGGVGNLIGFTLYGGYPPPNPPSRIIEAVAAGTVDTAIVWGPLAGYFGSRQAVPLTVEAVSPEVDLPIQRFVWDTAMGVRRGDVARRDELDRFLVRRRTEIETLLQEYGVPIVAAARRR